MQLSWHNSYANGVVASYRANGSRRSVAAGDSLLHFPRGGVKSYSGDTSTSRSGLGSGGEIGHQLCEKFETGKLYGVKLESTPADEAQDAGYALWRLDAARATPK